jgi:dihydroxy-acid dehydratase
MFTANSMNCLAEALGLALPGNGTILATSETRKDLYRAAARRIVGLVNDGITPRQIVTEQSLDNAMILDMAMGGSTNTLLHVMAIAREAGVDYTMDRINGLSEKTPNVCKVAPSSKYHVEDVHRAGGIMTILWEVLEGRPGLLNEDCITASGEKIGDVIRENSLRNKNRNPVPWLAADGDAPVGSLPPKLSDWDPMDCIRTVENAYGKSGGLTILYGNLAPEGSVVKTAGVDPKMLTHEGPAVIFESQEDACAGILNGKVKAGDVVVIRYEGPRGGPGMQEMLSPTSYIMGMDLGDKCALITDGRFSGGTSGACIGHISPEAAEGGPIGLLRDGDIIQIDIPGHTLAVKLSEAELEERRKEWKRPEPRMNFGWLARYQKVVTNAAQGAALER